MEHDPSADMRTLFMRAFTRLEWTSVLFYWRQMIGGARPPDIKGGQQENAHDEVADQASHHHDRKGTLRVGADVMR